MKKMMQRRYNIVAAVFAICAFVAGSTIRIFLNHTNNGSVNNSSDGKKKDFNISNKKEESSSCSIPNISTALQCFHKTNPNVTLRYPEDAIEHVIEIHNSIKTVMNNTPYHCYAKYCGPWIENFWIEIFGKNITSDDYCLSETFGPYIPLFFPWTDFWIANGSIKYNEVLNDILEILRPDVAYITVSQNDEGLMLKDRNMTEIKVDNILVLSGGGYGHVPIPLLIREQPLQEKPVTNRSHLVSYVGSLKHAPGRMRRKMHQILNRFLPPGDYKYYSGSNWTNVMRDSYLSLAPRGFGRTAFHLVEILQMGLIPIYVYDFLPWVPYRNLYESKLGYVVSISELANFATTTLKNSSLYELRTMEDQILSYRESHFTVPGIMNQIRLFMQGGGDLECGPMPENVRTYY